jgi:AcrR family transcriptional regulator
LSWVKRLLRDTHHGVRLSTGAARDPGHYAEPVTELRPAGPGETRGEKKERTRRAILDAALRLSEQTGLVGLSLRQVAKEVGIVPTAFYRHFASIDELGLALVEESFTSLRAMIRDVRRGNPSLEEIVDRSVEVLDEHVRGQRAHFSFIARERAGGSAVVRTAVRQEFALFERELATDLARLPMEHWSGDDLQVLSRLIVVAMIAVAEEILESPDREREAIRRRARTELLIVIVGALNWRSRS